MSICAFDKENECEALKEKNCKGCPFFKTEEALERGRQKARERIRTLPLAIRTKLFRKYYEKKGAKNSW